MLVGHTEFWLGSDIINSINSECSQEILNEILGNVSGWCHSMSLAASKGERRGRKKSKLLNSIGTNGKEQQH